MGGRVEGKVALVTGAGSEGGLGDAIARRLVEEGATVWLTDIDEAGASARAAEIGGSARGLGQDVTSEDDWARVLAETGPLDVLVNNAGIAVLRMIEELTPADYARQMEVNMTSAYLGMRAAIANMRAHGRGGSIINMSSVAGLVGIAGVSGYAASKAGLRLFGKAIAMETAKQKIRVNSVHPGMIMTGMQKVALQDNPDQYHLLTAGIPMGYMGEPIEIANMVLFLASEEARYITGAEFVVDGGMTAQ
ncbi:SDR family NAD(P)-dependent oxidoreductase [Sphingomonas jatrophae]|uniref:NAD(P)-dependent dehydrogenase, short-chain alcohol dehydrogenase family n=1 Tax=Sphingomonas jatrophae TaxID=1166337 RepID=A0A1I6M1M6_9SPHN|nr:glucose 1-dehydrogenase [Sphingomonas jatrophae]SFS09616.1 NAD(P)-dependent dehydrogenase, short-chain alcohol dehydrogenase family [Sphingomonas jatrophae]